VIPLGWLPNPTDDRSVIGCQRRTMAATAPRSGVTTGSGTAAEAATRLERPIIEVASLRKAYGATVAVADVSFAVAEGEIFGILGPNGAGKTTTVECLQSLRRPDSGTMRVLGLDPTTEAAQLRQRIGSQLQDSALPGRLRVAEAIELFAAFAEHPVDCDQLLARWRLEGQRAQAFDSLSGGQRQRLFIALAFVNSPELVFLDELTQGLDPQARRATWELIREIQEGGTTVVLVTHFMDEAEYLCDRVAVVDCGRVVALDTPQGLIDGLGLPSVVRFTTPELDLSWLGELDVVQSVARRGEAVEIRGTGPVLALVAAELVAHGIAPLDVRVDRPNVEDAFLALTGRGGRG
jgi:ABC-2 type transport system ATP-binding protein